MLELVLANLRTRPFRTFISVVGVALGVVLVVLFTGLARGMSNDMVKRANNWKAEIVFTRPGAMDSITSATANVSTAYVPRLLAIEGVKDAVPVYRYITPSAKGRWGIQQLDGVDWEPFAKMNDMQIVQGRPAVADNEVIVDERQARDDKIALGDTIQLLGNKDYKVTGIFSPPSGSRIKMSLAAMQAVQENVNRCSYILVKLNDPADTDKVAARINEALPGNKINLTRDLIVDAEDRVPSLGIFLKVLVGLGIFVSTIFVLLSMYTTITERRKEIGILKSLGASRLFIVRVIEQEAIMIGVLGVILGFIVSFIAAFIIEKRFELIFEFSWGWMITAVLIAIAGSLLGALYPAWKASSIDPVLVLANE
jgi:putative ABC transport system permease protein